MIDPDFSERLRFLDTNGLPRPDWASVVEEIDRLDNCRHRFYAWTDAARAWLTTLTDALPQHSAIAESSGAIVLMPKAFYPSAMATLTWLYREDLLKHFPSVASFGAPGKLVVIGIEREASYYDYATLYQAEEGEYGGSSGMQIRNDGYPHFVVHVAHLLSATATIAHECMHAALIDHSLPLWIEEGLAQMFEFDRIPEARPKLTYRRRAEIVYTWKSSGLKDFWSGRGFRAADERQSCAYELAEILVRMLVEDPRLCRLEWSLPHTQELQNFLLTAKKEDGGEAAAREHLGFGIEELAARFLDED